VKDQYFGDISDYRKYGLLRVLTDKGRIRTAVCWMLTKNDDRPSDGGKIGYLNTPAMSRHDPDLFKILKQGIQERKVAYAKVSGILDNAVYFKVEGNQVIVFWIFHCARDPRSVRTILRRR